MAFTIKKTFRGVQIKKDALTIDIEHGATIRIGNSEPVHLTDDEMVRVEAMFFKLAIPNDRDIATKVEDDLRRINPPKTPILQEGTVAKRMAENKEKSIPTIDKLTSAEWIMEVNE